MQCIYCNPRDLIMMNAVWIRIHLFSESNLEVSGVGIGNESYIVIFISITSYLHRI